MSHQRNKTSGKRHWFLGRYISLKIGSDDCWLRARTVEDLQSSDRDLYVCHRRYRELSRVCCCHLNCPITHTTCHISLSSSKRACRTWVPLSRLRYLSMALAEIPIYMPLEICCMNIFRGFVKVKKEHFRELRDFANIKATNKYGSEVSI